MRVTIIITPKSDVYDPEGMAVCKSLIENYNLMNITSVTKGKIFVINVNGDKDDEKLIDTLHNTAKSFLSNPIIEEYKLIIE